MEAQALRHPTALIAVSCLLVGVGFSRSPQSGATSAPQTSNVEVLTDDGMAVIGSYAESSSFLAPMTSLSPLVKRAALRRGAFEFQVGGADPGAKISVVALLHGADEFVVLDGERALVVGDVEAPASARAVGPAPPTWDLAHLVRRDGHAAVSAHDTEWQLELTPIPREGDADRMLLLFGQASGRPERMNAYQLRVDSVDASLRGSVHRPLVVEGSGASILSVPPDSISGWALDAAMYVTPSAPRWESLLEPSTESAAAGAGARRLLVRLPEEAETRLQGTDAGLTLWIRVDSPANEERPKILMRSSWSDADGSAGPLCDVTRESGIDAVHFEGAAEQLDIRPTMGPGAAWGDIDGDGRLDAVVLQGSGRSGTEPLADRVYRGLEGGRFEDITHLAGLGRGDAGMGALLLDVNGDGPLDLYCANYGQDRLFLGKGDGTFSEATVLLPKLDLWSASVTAADPDGDGDLDLYVTSYLDYDTDKMPPAEELGRYQREDPVEMLPFAFPGARNVFLRNGLAETGELSFEDATEALGLLDVQGRGMQTVFWDFDRDGDEDLYVANDVSFNVLFRNEGDGTFKDVSFSTGLDDPRGGMGLAVGDVDLDGDEDVFLTNWQLEANALYLNSVISHSSSKRRRASFHDYTVRSGLGPSGIGATSWGAELFDLDLDGDLDLYVANGYTSPDYESTGICVGQVDHLFLGDGTGRFAQVAAEATGIGALRQASRGAIGADYDGDGDVDLLVTANNGRAALLQNRAKREGRWIGVRLRQPGLNTRAIGAEVTVELANGAVFRRSMRAGQGYLTGNAPELHFGLGAAEANDSAVSVRVVWPDGERTFHKGRLDAWQTVNRGE